MGRPIINAARDAVIWELYEQGLSHAEIADRMGITKNASSEAVRGWRARYGLPARTRSTVHDEEDDGAGAPRPESPRAIVLRLSTQDFPMTIREISQATGLSENLVRAIRFRLRASGRKVPLEVTLLEDRDSEAA